MTDETPITLEENTEDTDDWTLTVDQMLFILKHRDRIDAAFEQDDMAWLRELEASSEYVAVFQDMSFDEAYDRYECMLEDDSATS